MNDDPRDLIGATPDTFSAFNYECPCGSGFRLTDVAMPDGFSLTSKCPHCGRVVEMLPATNATIDGTVTSIAKCSHFVNERRVPCPPMCWTQSWPRSMFRLTLFGNWTLRRKYQ